MRAEMVEQVARWLQEAQSVCVCTGAGMSAESGVPTFRDAGGLWAAFDPGQLATPEAFVRDPLKVWDWYRARRRQLREVQPHEGHRVLAEWEARHAGLVVVTQNVDGLHHRAGSQRVIELHGRLDEVRCTACAYAVRTLEDLGPDPQCPECGQRLRPGVVWFGEMLPAGALEQAMDAARRCDLLLVIGTSGVVQPAACLPDLAHAYGATLVEINPRPSAVSHLARVALRCGCREALSALDAAWRRLGS